MIIKRTKHSGFCAGVNNAVEKTKKLLINSNEPLYCLGQIVHNETVINDLENNGLITINDITEAPNNSKVIIRAHGEPPKTYEKAKEKNIEIIDLTCAKVALIHKKIEDHKNDYYIIIIGKKIHPEIIADIGYCNDNMIVIENIDDIKNINNESKPIYIVSQTTFSSKKFDEIVKEIKKQYNNITIDKTICNVTELHQQEVSDLSKESTKMIIIGGKNSSNTKELYNISKNNCNETILISTPVELDKTNYNKTDIIGIAAGASTPISLVDELEEIINNTL